MVFRQPRSLIPSTRKLVITQVIVSESFSSSKYEVELKVYNRTSDISSICNKSMYWKLYSFFTHLDSWERRWIIAHGIQEQEELWYSGGPMEVISTISSSPSYVFTLEYGHCKCYHSSKIVAKKSKKSQTLHRKVVSFFPLR